jgi:hypothetical protein
VAGQTCYVVYRETYTPPGDCLVLVNVLCAFPGTRAGRTRAVGLATALVEEHARRHRAEVMESGCRTGEFRTWCYGGRLTDKAGYVFVVREVCFVGDGQESPCGWAGCP